MPNSARIDVGTRSASTSIYLPYRTYFHDIKVQFVVLASELSSRGIKSGDILTGITFYASAQPGRALNNLRIRLKETTNTSLSSGTETSGLLLVNHSSSISRTLITADSSYRHDFNINEFYYSGQNLIVEVTRDDTGCTTGGGMYVRTGLSSARLRGGGSDSNEGSYPFRSMTLSQYSLILDCSIHYRVPLEGPKGFSPSWETITAKSSGAKASHFTELRNLINDYETDPQGASKTKSTWADTISFGSTFVKNEHYNELKSKIAALNPIPASKPFPSSWSDLADGASITKSQMDSLRNNLTYAYQTCFKSDTCTTCNTACYGCDCCDSACDYCNYCDSSCDGCDSCNSACDWCDGCNTGCYGCDYCDIGCLSCDVCDLRDGCQYCDSICDHCDNCDESCNMCESD